MLSSTNRLERGFIETIEGQSHVIASLDPAAVMPPPPETLSEQARAALAAAAAALPADVFSLDMAQMRFFAEQMQIAIGAEQRKSHPVTITDDVIAGVSVRHRPRLRSHRQKRVLMNLHGGGFTVDAGSITENVPIAAITGMEVVAVLYRFAPEHPFPAAVDDALAVYKALLADHDPRDIGVYGTSAGAVIGPQLIMRLTAESLPLPGALGVFSGEADLVGVADSLRIFARTAEGDLLIRCKGDYVGKADPRDPLVSPIRGDLSGFPPTLCVSSGRDVLLSGTANLSRALTDAGVSSEFVVYDALPHAFWDNILAPGSRRRLSTHVVLLHRQARRAIAIVPSLTARAVQSLMRAAFSGRMAHDEAALRKALQQGRRSSTGDPPGGLYRQCTVDVRKAGEHRIFTVWPRDDGPVRGQILYLPGGGYVNPPAFLHWWFIAKLVKTLGVACTVPLYPLAPEHLCDEGIAFANEVYDQLVSEHGAQNLLVMGDSAGGGLALALLQQAKTPPAGLMLDAPWLDASVSDPSQVEIGRKDWLLNRFTLRTWGQWWAGPRDLQDPIVSPLFGDLSELPQTLLFCGSADILVADARRLAGAAPGKVKYIEEEGLMHVYPLLPFLPEARRAWLEIERFVDGVLIRGTEG